MSNLPFISILIPCLNESKYIDNLIESLVSQDYPKEKLEVLLIDGMSSDNTRQKINDYSKNLNWIQLVDNPKRNVPVAMNLGIKKSKGEYIIRLDAHAIYTPNYFTNLILSAQKFESDNIGTVFAVGSKSNTSIAKAITYALSHPLGVGNSLFRIGITKPTEADTVPFGCFKKSTLVALGGYNERLVRNQDIELNKRILRNNGKIILLPDMGGTYFARETLLGLWKNNYENGRWVILTAYLTNSLSSLSVRHFVPLMFFVYLLSIPILAFSGLPLLLLPIIAYLLVMMMFSRHCLIKSNDKAVALASIAVLPVLHLSYGVGSLVGVWQVVIGKIKK